MDPKFGLLWMLYSQFLAEAQDDTEDDAVKFKKASDRTALAYDAFLNRWTILCEEHQAKMAAGVPVQ